MFSRNVRSERKTAVDEYRYTDTDKKKKNQYFFLFNLVDFGHLFSWFPVFLVRAGWGSPHLLHLSCFVFSLMKLIAVPGSRTCPSGNVFVLVKKTVSTNVCCVCVCGQFCFIFYGGENVFHNAVSFCSQCEGARLVQECVSEVSVCVDLIVQGCAVRLVRKWSGFAWLATDFSI